MKPMLTKPSWKNQLSICLIGIQVLQTSKKVHFLTGPGKLSCMGQPKKKRYSPKPIGSAGED